MAVAAREKEIETGGYTEATVRFKASFISGTAIKWTWLGGPYLYVILCAPPGHEFNVGQVVLVVKKSLLAPVAALRYMMGIPGATALAILAI